MTSHPEHSLPSHLRKCPHGHYDGGRPCRLCVSPYDTCDNCGHQRRDHANHIGRLIDAYRRAELPFVRCEGFVMSW